MSTPSRRQRTPAGGVTNLLHKSASATVLSTSGAAAPAATSLVLSEVSGFKVPLPPPVRDQVRLFTPVDAGHDESYQQRFGHLVNVWWCRRGVLLLLERVRRNASCRVIDTILSLRLHDGCVWNGLLSSTVHYVSVS